MKKILILILGIIVAVPAMSQTTELVEVIKRWPNRIDVNVTHGLVHTRLVSDTNDSAFYFHANGKQFIATTTFSEVGLPPVDPPPVVDIVTDIDDAVSSVNKYEPSSNAGINQPNSTGWSHYANNDWNTNHLNKSASFISVNGYIETTFDGYKVEWYTEKRNNHGVAAISIDGGAEVMIDLYDATLINNYRLAWTSPEFTSGDHKVKVRLTGTKNPASEDTNIIHDFFRVYKKGG